jgi:ribosomal protein S18 acetylase RimI-like enzyme
MTQWTIRTVRSEDLEQCAMIEAAGFPAQEAASKQVIAARIAAYPEHFLVAVDEDNVPIGYVMGPVISQPYLEDWMFGDTSAHRMDGMYQAVFSVCVREDMRCRGVAAGLLEAFYVRACRMGLRAVTLTCKKEKIGYYETLGYRDCGIAKSVHGNAVWYNMMRPCTCTNA